jgi:hypothetical protein
MTLSTNVLLSEYHEPRPLLDWINENLLQIDPSDIEESETNIRNRIMQGFSAIVDIDHKKGETFAGSKYGDINDYKREYYESDEEFQAALDEFKEVEEGYQASRMHIDFDTAYGYQGPNGEGCSELHASFIFKLREYLPESTTIRWQNEFTGDWYVDLDGLETLVSGGLEAQNWFHNIAKPAIEASLPEGSRVVY